MRVPRYLRLRDINGRLESRSRSIKRFASYIRDWLVFAAAMKLTGYKTVIIGADITGGVTVRPGSLIVENHFHDGKFGMKFDSDKCGALKRESL